MTASHPAPMFSPRRLARLAAIAGLAALAACQAGGPMPQAAAPAPPAAPPVPKLAGLRAIPPCPDGIRATLATGLTVRFQGSAADDPAVCVQSWDRRKHRFYLGFWGDGRFGHGTPEQRAKIAAVLQAPVGSTVSFALPRRTPLALWKSATVQHVANARVMVGARPHSAVKLRVVLRDALGRPQVKAERLYWIDRATGVPLREQVVTRTADGGSWRTTIWQLDRLRGAGNG